MRKRKKHKAHKVEKQHKIRENIREGAVPMVNFDLPFSMP